VIVTFITTKTTTISSRIEPQRTFVITGNNIYSSNRNNNSINTNTNSSNNNYNMD